MKKILTYFKIEAILALRNIDILFFGVLMPIGIAALIAAIGGSAETSEGYSYLQSIFGSLITVGICATAFMGLPLCLADYRDKKILKQFFVTPVHPGFLLGVQAAINAMIAAISAFLIYLLLKVFWGYEITGNGFMVIISFGLVLASMYGLGMLLASLCRTIKAANLVCTLVYFPMLFLSGATVPYELFPDWLQAAASILPLTHGIKLLKGYSLYQQPENMAVSFVILGILTAMGIIVSIKLFKWE